MRMGKPVGRGAVVGPATKKRCHEHHQGDGNDWRLKKGVYRAGQRWQWRRAQSSSNAHSPIGRLSWNGGGGGAEAAADCGVRRRRKGRGGGEGKGKTEERRRFRRRKVPQPITDSQLLRRIVAGGRPPLARQCVQPRRCFRRRRRFEVGGQLSRLGRPLESDPSFAAAVSVFALSRHGYRADHRRPSSDPPLARSPPFLFRLRRIVTFNYRRRRARFIHPYLLAVYPRLRHILPLFTTRLLYAGYYSFSFFSALITSATICL